MSDQQPVPYDPNADFDVPEIEWDRSIGAGSEVGISGGIPLSQNAITPFMPRDTNDLKALVRVIVRGGVVPQGYLMPDPKNRSVKIPDMSKMAAGIIAGRERGWGPMKSLTYIMFVNGAASVWGKGAKGDIMQSGKLEDYRLNWIDNSTLKDVPLDEIVPSGWVDLGSYSGDKKTIAKSMLLPAAGVAVLAWPDVLTAHVAARRKGVDTPYVGMFSVGDAKRAKLWASAKKHPWLLYPQDMLQHKAAARVWDRGFADCLAGMPIWEDVYNGEERQLAAPADLTFLGAPEEAKDAPLTPEQQATAERDLLLHGLEKCGTKDVLDGWFQASEGRVQWLRGADPAAADAVNAAYIAKAATFEVNP